MTTIDSTHPATARYSDDYPSGGDGAFLLEVPEESILPWRADAGESTPAPDEDARPAADEYSYHRSSDGCDDVFLIEDSDGNRLLKLHFWAEPDTAEAAVAEAKARMIVAALNVPGGGWAQTPYTDRILLQNRQVATIWDIHDVQRLRPELNDDQAWEVLKAADRHPDAASGITRDTLKAAAQSLFPVDYERTGEPCI